MLTNILYLFLIIIPVSLFGQPTNMLHGPSAEPENLLSEALSTEVEMPFFISGKTYSDLESSDENSSDYFDLGKEYITISRNFMSNTIPVKVLTAFNDASILFTIYTPSEISNLPYSNKILQEFRTLTTILRLYNKEFPGCKVSADKKVSGALIEQDEYFESDLSQWIYHRTLKKSQITRLY